MSQITICITNDIDYDRRIKRTIDGLSIQHDVEVISRRLHPGGAKNKVNCIFNTGFLFYAEYNIRLFFMLLVRKVDIIVAVDYDTLIAASLVSKLRGKKLIFDAHELFEESIEISSRPQVKKFWDWVGRKFVPIVDRAYTVSNTIADFYQKKHGVKFGVIRNVPLSKKPAGLSDLQEKKIILYQGVLNEGRMIELLVKVTDYLPEEYEVWILGEGDIGQKLRSIASKGVIFHSWVDPGQLSEYTSQAFLAYNLLESASKSYYFSLANKFFDYLHAGVPSLNSPFPEYKRYNERYNCCYINDPETAEALAKWIREIERDEMEWREKRKNSFLASKDLNWEKEQKKLLNIYDFNRHTDL